MCLWLRRSCAGGWTRGSEAHLGGPWVYSKEPSAQSNWPYPKMLPELPPVARQNALTCASKSKLTLADVALGRKVLLEDEATALTNKGDATLVDVCDELRLDVVDDGVENPETSGVFVEAAASTKLPTACLVGQFNVYLGRDGLCAHLFGLCVVSLADRDT